MKNWQLNIDAQQIAWLHFDNENNKVNILRSPVVKELNEILDDLIKSPPKALIFLSNKESGFCMGADIHEFENNTDLEVLKEYVRYGQSVMQKIADLNFPTIALINGFCLGGGLELSLACRYRIAQEDALLGLPEVRLGVQPAWGGSVRLPQLIHPLKALNMMLTGRMIKAYPAKKMGLVDVCVPKRQMLNAARSVALTGLPKRKKQLSHLFTRAAITRRLVAALVRYQVTKQANPAHYPAPFMIIDNWKQYGACGTKAYEAEVASFIKLLEGDTAKNLVRLFLLQEQLKAAGKKTDARVQHIHVIGAGTMGGDIAIWCMQKGLTVSLQDRTPKDLSRAMARAYELCPNPKLLDKLIPDVNGDGLAHADIIIEAVFENLDVKKNLLNEIKDKIKPNAIIASNTSSIALKEFPFPVVGIHFFNPVAKMQLVEVVHTENLSQDISDRALAFVHQIGKLPLKVKDCPGFLVNRVIAPYLLETVHLIDEGVPIEQLDKVAKDFGMMMGPVAMVDLIGLDICLAAVKNLGGEAPKTLVDKVARGNLGKKTGEGFYHYKNGKVQSVKTSGNASPINADEILDRLMLALINECVACLGESIVASSDEVDAGIIFGMGFAPFRGGPLQYAKSIGYKKIYEKLKSYEEKVGVRFAPKSGWDRLLEL
jgi:3-hydroxyacyl-CoA dehydrogenase/enoyl-CoA hydratase/3-hydroxybutyryl-CoA epimerase